MTGMPDLATGRFTEPWGVADAVVPPASPRSGGAAGAEFVVGGRLPPLHSLAPGGCPLR
ncbi:hypothetical protein ABZ023_06720 [Streptomyces sp. NPDC006367]|uniref:hypothetical protein n=1 Tax=unclassified Streptomyces TaxID=2593676 RepID=UPI0033A0CCA1